MYSICNVYILELSDGVAIAEALTQIAPEFFTPVWNSKIKTEVTGHNWRLKVSNLKKILDGVLGKYIKYNNCRWNKGIS